MWNNNKCAFIITVILNSLPEYSMRIREYLSPEFRWNAQIVWNLTESLLKLLTKHLKTFKLWPLKKTF